jgi:hypothetical protein
LPDCDNALAAADLDAALVRPSRRTDDAAVAAFDEVVFAGAPDWDNALPAAVFDREPVEMFWSVFEAFEAARPPVILPISYLSCIAVARGTLAWGPHVESERTRTRSVSKVNFATWRKSGKRLNASDALRKVEPQGEPLLHDARAILLVY